MKRLILFLSPLLLCGILFATENNEIVQQVNDLEEQTIQLNEDQLNFQTFSSCEEMSITLEKFIKDHFDTRGGYYGRGGGGIIPMMEDGVSAVAADQAKEAPTPTSTSSDSVDYSATNVQVAGVDEPEILKSDWDYLYYFNQRLQKIFIINSPLNRTTHTVNLSTAQIVSLINIPWSFSNVQLFVREGQLIILAQRRRDIPQPWLLDNSSKTDVIIYDTTDISIPKLIKFADLDGTYQDARLVDDQLYVVSQLGINRRWLPQTYKTAAEVTVDAQELLPKVIDVSYTQDSQKQNLKVGAANFPYQISVQRADCDSTFYVLPTDESIKQYGLTPQFTVVRALDVSRPERAAKTTTAFGSTQTIHLTPDALYLANNFRMGSNSRCPLWTMCIWPGGGIENGTLLHKFTLDGTTMTYVDSALIPGSPLTQRSMSEDSDGNFRILTKTWMPQVATHLVVLDKELHKLGSLLHIEPGEEFKASRFIWDKLYLVTFEQTDPLFVIDLQDLTDPTIIGSLVLPGFSTYLHPYSSNDTEQRLIGLWYNITGSQWGGTVTNGIKVDLYKVDYADVDENGMIAVDQVVTKTFSGRGSDTEALYNPRLFVRNSLTHQLVLPMVLQQTSPGKNCNVEYDTKGNVIREQCRDTETYTTQFAWLKAISIQPEGISEVASYDYSELLKQDKQAYMERDMVQGDVQIQPRQFNNLQFRAGYLGDVLYVLNNLFGHFVIPNEAWQEIYVPLDGSVIVK